MFAFSLHLGKIYFHIQKMSENFRYCNYLFHLNHYAISMTFDYIFIHFHELDKLIKCNVLEL